MIPAVYDKINLGAGTLFTSGTAPGGYLGQDARDAKALPDLRKMVQTDLFKGKPRPHMTGGKIQCMTPEMLIPPVPVFYKPEIEPGIVVCQLVTRVLFFFSEKRNCPDKPAVEKIFQYL